MKILFCNNGPLDLRLGAAKVLIELASALESLGCQCTLVDPKTIAWDHSNVISNDYQTNLRKYLRSHANAYDVVDYSHEHLPYNRVEFASKTLFVARSVLLVHHFLRICIPTPRGWRSTLRKFLNGKRIANEWDSRKKKAHKTITEADLVNVPCQEDKVELMRNGVAEQKIAVIPYGLDANLRTLYNEISSDASKTFCIIAFVGTFDYRKGAVEFPSIVAELAMLFPRIKFRLLGTKGLFQSVDAVRKQFPENLRNRIEIFPQFKPRELPTLLADCSLGIFPSYIEGFGFGVLEMLAGSLPVIAYQAPGPTMMLPPDWLVAAGDHAALVSRVASLLRNPDFLLRQRIRAKSISQEFTWDRAAKLTLNIYRSHLPSSRRMA